MSGYKVETLDAETTTRVLRQLQGGADPMKQSHRKMQLSGGFELHGVFELTARNAETGEVEWEHSQANLVTDYGRVCFAANNWANCFLGFMPSREAPSLSRITVSTDPTQCFVSGNQGAGTVTAGTYTRNFGPITFSAPGTNRTLGTVYINTIGDGIAPQFGPYTLSAYAVLSPSKVQTTSQTVELNYKISMNPVA